MDKEKTPLNMGQERISEEIEKLQQSREKYEKGVKERAGGLFSRKKTRETIIHRDAVIDDKLLEFFKSLYGEKFPLTNKKIGEAMESNLEISRFGGSEWHMKGTIGGVDVELEYRDWQGGGYFGVFNGKTLSSYYAEMLWKKFEEVARARMLIEREEINKERKEKLKEKIEALGKAQDSNLEISRFGGYEWVVDGTIGDSKIEMKFDLHDGYSGSVDGEKLAESDAEFLWEKFKRMARNPYNVEIY